MRKRKKIETVRIRKANATIKKDEVLYFAKDQAVSTRMLAILSVTQIKSGVKEAIKDANGKIIATSVPEIIRYKVICGSNGKIGTRYNVIKIPKDKKDIIIKKMIIDNGPVGQQLTIEEFVDMYPSQCNIFKKIFENEYNNACKAVK